MSLLKYIESVLKRYTDRSVGCPTCTMPIDYRFAGATLIAHLLIGAGIDPQSIKKGDGSTYLVRDSPSGRGPAADLGLKWSWGVCFTIEDFLKDLRRTMPEKSPPISPGTKVRTTEPNMTLRKEWTDEGWASKKWGVQGLVITHHDSHGLCYDVRHDDGTEGCYDPSEIVLL